MLRRISPGNGYCLFFPSRKPGQRFVSGQSVRVWPWEEWKHVKLGVFEVQLPGQQAMLVTTSELLECNVKASFRIVVGGAKEGREERLEKATLSCPANRSLRKEDQVELVPFFRDWAINYCITAVINTVKACQYVHLIEEADYRSKAEKGIEEFARSTLADIGLILVQCTVIVEPMEPTSIFATPEIVRRWEAYKETVNEAELSKKKAENHYIEAQRDEQIGHSERLQRLEEQERRAVADIKQETEIRLRELALELKRKEAALAIEEQQELSNKDSRMVAIQEEMAKRAQAAQLQRIRREGELEQQRQQKDSDLAALKLQHESEQLDRQQDILAKQKLDAEKNLELLAIDQQRSATEIELERDRGQVRADNIEKELLAKGSQEAKMRELLLKALPSIIEQASRPVEKIGEIRAINVTGGLGADGAGSNLGSFLASASSLPIIKEFLKFLGEIEGSERGSPAHTLQHPPK